MSEIKTLEQYAVARIEELEQQVERLKVDNQRLLDEIEEIDLNLKAFGQHMTVNDHRFELSIWSSYDDEYDAAIRFFKPYIPDDNIHTADKPETKESTEESTEE